MSTSTFHPVADTYLDMGSPSSNFGSEPLMFLSAYVGSIFYRGLWRFDLTAPTAGDPIPADATIYSATLYLTGTDKLGKGIDPLLLHFYRGEQEWVETEATWNHYAGALSWGSEPGDPDYGVVDDGVSEPWVGVIEVTATTLVADAVVNRGRVVQLVAITVDVDEIGIILASREGEGAPLLTVDWEAPPLPPTSKPAAYYYNLLSRPRT